MAFKVIYNTCICFPTNKANSYPSSLMLTVTLSYLKYQFWNVAYSNVLTMVTEI